MLLFWTSLHTYVCERIRSTSVYCHRGSSEGSCSDLHAVAEGILDPTLEFSEVFGGFLVGPFGKITKFEVAGKRERERERQELGYYFVAGHFVACAMVAFCRSRTINCLVFPEICDSYTRYYSFGSAPTFLFYSFLCKNPPKHEPVYSWAPENGKRCAPRNSFAARRPRGSMGTEEGYLNPGECSCP